MLLSCLLCKIVADDILNVLLLLFRENKAWQADNSNVMWEVSS